MHSDRNRVASIAIWISVSFVFSGCSEETPPKVIRPVRVMKVGDVGGFSGRPFPGRAEAAEEVNLSFRVSGPLVAMAVQVGDVVEEGQLLAQIDPRDFEVAIQGAEANLQRVRAGLQAMEAGARPEELEQLKAAVQRAQGDLARAQSDFERGAQLVESRAITREEYDRRRQALIRTQADLRSAEQALKIGEGGAREEDIAAKRAEIRSLEAALAEANNRRDDTVLVASFAGKIAATYVENFQAVQAKEPILRLLDTSRIEMTIDVPESGISLVQYAKDIVCTFKPSKDRVIQVPAQIKEIGTEASRTTRTYPVTLIMDQPKDDEILPGFSGTARGRVELPEGAEQRGLEVPASAVFEGEQGQEFVWVVDAATNTVKRLEVTTGELTPRGILVKGLQQGLLIATAGVHYLQEGQKIRILGEQAEEGSK